MTARQYTSALPMLVLSFVFALVLAGVMFYFLFQNKGGGAAGSIRPYSAVFLSNGQAYFGHAEREGDELVLTGVYYISAASEVEAGQAEEQPVSLVRLGNEVHGPTDEIRINYEHVIFTETLKEDSQVVKAIRAQSL